MKRFAYILTILSVMLLTVNSCVVVADDDWDDGYSSYYDYICNGRWYPESPSGLTECEYNSYMTFLQMVILTIIIVPELIMTMVHIILSG